jgi:hypothetical protein
MAWELHKRTTRPSPKNPMVTLSKSGMIGLNSAVTRNILGENKFAHLLFEKEKRLIGIRFLKQSDPDTYPVKYTKSRSHATISGVSFLKANNIFPSETTAYPATYDEPSKILVVNISGKAEGWKEAIKRRVKTE